MSAVLVYLMAMAWSITVLAFVCLLVSGGSLALDVWAQVTS